MTTFAVVIKPPRGRLSQRRGPFPKLIWADLLFFLSATLGAHWTDLNQNLPYVRKWKCMSKVCAIPHPKNWGQKLNLSCFLTPLQLNGNFNGGYRPNETRYRQSGNSLWTTTKFHELWFTDAGKRDRIFYPPFFGCQASYTEVMNWTNPISAKS